MRYSKLLIASFLLLSVVSCKKNNKQITDALEKTQIKVRISDTLIGGIDSSKIENLNTNKEKIIDLFFKSFQKEYNKPLINFNRVKNSKEKIEVKKYSTFDISGTEYNSFLISFTYENDELYKSILLTNSLLDDGLIIYEKVLDEGEYLRTTRISKNIITNSVFQIEHFKYDKEGNISGELEKKDSLLVMKNNYLIQENYFSEYFKEADLNLSRKWGAKEIIYTKDVLDSSYVYLYEQKGKIQNHLKVGNWEERKYIMEYDKSVWLDGNYVRGLKNGKWHYSPDGPVDKVEIYEMGKLIKTSFP